MKSNRILNNYHVIYKPDHPTSMSSGNWEGYVYEHIYVIENYLGRSLREEEVVHHLDCNPMNNRIENLLLLTRDMHPKIHAWIDSGAFICESYKMNGMNSGKSKVTEPTYCEICDITLQGKQVYTCSNECNIARRNKNSTRPSKEQLASDIATMSWSAIGRKYNVSGNAAKKWAKKYELL